MADWMKHYRDRVARCARCGVPATHRVRWFLSGQYQPMFDVCDEHVQIEERLELRLSAEVEGAPAQCRVRVTLLPEQLVLAPYLGVVIGEVPVPDKEAALALYRTCRERDFRPVEAVEYVRAQVLEILGHCAASNPVLTTRCGRLLWYIETRWLPVVARWLAEGAETERRMDLLLYGTGPEAEELRRQNRREWRERFRAALEEAKAMPLGEDSEWPWGRTLRIRTAEQMLRGMDIAECLLDRPATTGGVVTYQVTDGLLDDPAGTAAQYRQAVQAAEAGCPMCGAPVNGVSSVPVEFVGLDGERVPIAYDRTYEPCGHSRTETAAGS